MTKRLVNNLWYRRLDAAIRAQGGMLNAHLHLDRAGTLDVRQTIEEVLKRIAQAGDDRLGERIGAQA